jgi:translation initiation factor 3 subunit A
VPPEFIDVGKKVEALEILCDVLRSRKHRTWQKYHDDIMLKYLELCVDLRKSYVAKEGIYQYKIICQQTQIKSFEDVVRKYLEMAEAKAEAARIEAQASTVDVDDLENLATPENILLSAVSSEVSQDRTDRVVLLPWVKFLWESYRQCLDLLRNYGRTERLYHDIARQAFEFCIKYNRKTEFRKLCDNLHTHLDTLKKQLQYPMQHHANQAHVNLGNPETQALHLETRLLQLDCAITMELWQEAYKATDDIKRFNLMNLQKKTLKPQIMAGYYHKLALVFQKANCPIFHAAALMKHFNLNKEFKKSSKEEELTRLASKVVAATLSMPIPPNRPEIDKLVDTEENVIENHHRNLASLLGMITVVPTRYSLIRDLKRMNILAHATPELQHLYNWLEVDFDPILLCKRVEGVVKMMENSDDLKQYVASLKEVTIVRLLKEVTQVYSSMQMSRLLELCPYVDPVSLESIVVNSARRNDIQIRIDHRKQCLTFGSLMSHTDEVIEGPFLQSMPSSQMRQQLVNVFSVLQRAKCIIEKEKIKSARESLKKKIVMIYEKNREIEHASLLDRQEFIEARKDFLEQERQDRGEEERRQVEEAQRRIREEEQKRMQKESEEREQQKIQQEKEELKRRMAKDTIETLRQTEAGQKILETLNEEDLYDLKVDEIRMKQYEQLEKERKELQAKQLKFEKKIDHLERAKRIEEIPFLQEQYEKEKIFEKELFEEMEKQRIAELVAERELALKHRDRLLRMTSHAEAFQAKIRQNRQQEFQIKHQAWKQRIDKVRRERLQDRANQRKEKRRMEYLKEKKEREEAEREAELRAKMAAEKKAREEANRKLEEIAAKQRAREEEIEQKRLQQEHEAREQERKRREEEMYRAPPKPSDSEPWRASGPSRRIIPQPNHPVAVKDDTEEVDWRRKPVQPQNPEVSAQKYRPRMGQDNQQQPPLDPPKKVVPVRDAAPDSEARSWRGGPSQNPLNRDNRNPKGDYPEGRSNQPDYGRRMDFQEERRQPRNDQDQGNWRRGGSQAPPKADQQDNWRSSGQRVIPQSQGQRQGRFDGLKGMF